MCAYATLYSYYFLYFKVQHIINIKKYGKVAAMQTSEMIKQNVTWYILYSGGRFSWSRKWARSFRESSAMLVLTHLVA
jgi:hypothetical protein